MKLSSDKYQSLLSAIQPLSPKLQPHFDTVVSKDNRVKDPAKRLRWDALWASKWKVDYSDGVNDTHIDTALRAVMRELGFPQFS